VTLKHTTISLVIPTYNRVGLLKRALESAVDLDYPPEHYEIIVVDNGSSNDTTAAVVHAMSNKNVEHNISYIREERLGLHNARHAGTWAAKGNILLFTDDDARFDRGWLRAYAEAFDAHPEMAAAGGPVRPSWETPPPKWLIELMHDPTTFGMFSLMEPYDDFCLNPDGMFFGVNMAIRRNTLINLGGFNPEAFGDMWLGDGETGLVYKLWDHKLPIGYVPGALVYHHIPSTRMTVKYLRRRMANQGMCDLYSQFHRHLPKPPSIFKQATRLALTHAQLWIRASWARDRTDVHSLNLQLEAARTQAQLRYMLKIALSKKFQNFVAKKDWLNELGPLPDSTTVPRR
jgi:glucosyl-dolichyl phosphate glucuronosyltransferase